jgi:hypothetical protein
VFRLNPCTKLIGIRVLPKIDIDPDEVIELKNEN